MQTASPALSTPLEYIEGLHAIADRYDALLIDLWGVVHDGSALYPHALAALRHLAQHGKKVVFLSNAPRVAAKSAANLTRLGVDASLYAGVVTSGQAAHDMLQTANDWGVHYYYLGPGKDEDILADLPYSAAASPEKAQFILCTGFEYDYQPEAEIEPLLVRLAALKLPMICTNPDLEVVKQDGTRLLCAGWVAGRYEQLGGKVTYIGKPYPLVYETALTLLGNPQHGRVLAIGDNLATDIMGAQGAGIDSVLITGGILTSEAGHAPDAATLALLCAQAGCAPRWVMKLFAP